MTFMLRILLATILTLLFTTSLVLADASPNPSLCLDKCQIASKLRSHASELVLRSARKMAAVGRSTRSRVRNLTQRSRRHRHRNVTPEPIPPVVIPDENPTDIVHDDNVDETTITLDDIIGYDDTDNINNSGGRNANDNDNNETLDNFIEDNYFELDDIVGEDDTQYFNDDDENEGETPNDTIVLDDIVGDDDTTIPKDNGEGSSTSQTNARVIHTLVLPNDYKVRAMVNFDNSNLNEVPREICKMRQLKSLSLRNNKISDYTFLSSLEKLKNLRNLDLRGNPVLNLRINHDAVVASVFPRLTHFNGKRIDRSAINNVDLIS